MWPFSLKHCIHLHVRFDNELVLAAPNQTGPRKVRLVVAGIKIRDKPQPKEIHMELVLELRTKQFAKVKLQPTDAEGNPTEIDPDVAITTPTTSGRMRLILSDTVLPNGARELYVIPGPNPETSTGDVTGDAAPGSDEELITLTIKLVTSQPNATGFSTELLSTGALADLPPEIKAKL